MRQSRPAALATMRISASCSSWPRPRTRDRQPVADIGQVVFHVAIFIILRAERHAADLAVAGGEAPAGGAHAAPFRTVDRHRVDDAERGRQNFGADALARALYMAGGAGEVELAAPRVEIFLAVLVGRERARIVRDLDVHRLAARGEGHVAGQRRHFVPDIGERWLAIGLAAAVQRQLKRDDLAFLLVEVRIVLANADAFVREAVLVAL